MNKCQCLQKGLWMRRGFFFFCTAGQRGHPGVNSFLMRDDEQLMARSEAHQNATASGRNVRGARGGGKSLLVVWMRRGRSGGSCSNKSIKTEFMIRGYIHLKGQTRLKLTAGGICEYYIIYVLNIPQPEGVWKMSKHAKVQPIKQKGVAQQSESAWERGDDVTDVGWCLQDPVWDFDLHSFLFFYFLALILRCQSLLHHPSCLLPHSLWTNLLCAPLMAGKAFVIINPHYKSKQ